MNERKHEPYDQKVRVAVISGGVLLVVLAVVLIAVVMQFHWLADRARRTDTPPSPLATQRGLPPEPRLQVAPVEDLRKMRAHEDDMLSTYGWVDREQGIVRIPIERAMELVSQ